MPMIPKLSQSSRVALDAATRPSMEKSRLLAVSNNDSVTPREGAGKSREEEEKGGEEEEEEEYDKEEGRQEIY